MPRSKAPVSTQIPARNGLPAEDVPVAVAPPPAKDAKAAKEKSNLIIIKAPRLETIRVPIVGTTSLICSAFPDKLKVQMKEKRQTEESVQNKRGPRPARDFEREFRNSLYPWPDGKSYGFPAVAFKRSIVGACRQVSNLDMTMANRIIFVNGEVDIKGSSCVKLVGTPKIREDVVRLNDKDRNPDLRYRGEFWPWSCVLTIEFNGDMLNQQGVLNLLLHAGIFEGVGEMRPSAPKKSFNHGRFTIKENR